jgi:hypothetical protein
MKINRYKTNFNGYLPILRSIQHLLKDNSLNFSQLGAFICFVAQADWDKRHIHYTTIIRDDTELAREWGCSLSTVNRKRKELIKLGLLLEEDGLTKITNLQLFELDFIKKCAKIPPTITKTFFAKKNGEVALIVETLAETQANQLQNNPQSSNVSFKDNLGLSDKEIEDIMKGGEKE